MENTQITLADFKALAEKYGDGETAKDLELMHQTVAKNTSLTEFRYFLNVAKANGLNPFKKEIWCYKDNKGNQIIFAGRDGFLKKAQENPAFNGMRSCEVRANDKLDIDVANGRVDHKITTLSDKERGEIIGAYAIAFRKDGEATIEIVSWETYNKAYNQGPWQTHPAEMIKKVAEAHALKKAFGISQLQTEEDFVVRGDKAMPLGTEVTAERVTNPQIAEGMVTVYNAMLQRIEWAETERKLETIKSDIKKQESFNLLTPEALEELRVKCEAKLSEIKNDRDNKSA